MKLSDYCDIEPYTTILVLNSSCEAINFTSWKRAIRLVLRNKAVVVTPRVVRLVQYVKLPMSRLMANLPSRQLIFRRDDATCQYCGSIKNLTIDHVVPKSRGGGDTWTNMVVACLKCNLRKGDMPLEKTDLVLYKKPRAPYNKMQLSLHKCKVPEWKPYAFADIH
jgi:5-methylcytosine-specific restriction endonuclease McrA